jgi:putative glutamine amidotransferase
MKKLPLILIVPSNHRQGAEFSDVSLSLSNRYTQAIEDAGGLPWVLPATLAAETIMECVRRSDGVMLTGGDDVQAELYAPSLPRRLRQKVHEPDPVRDLLEMLLIEAVFHWRKPLLAICRGQQILNVALGGTLLVDIASQLPKALNHQRTDRKDAIVHDVVLTPGSLLATLSGQTSLGVNSSHHQAVARVARPFQASAVSADGVIEGLELDPAEAKLLPYMLAVQFHPERLCSRHPVFLELFRSFTRACVPAGKKSV